MILCHNKNFADFCFCYICNEYEAESERSQSFRQMRHMSQNVSHAIAGPLSFARHFSEIYWRMAVNHIQLTIKELGKIDRFTNLFPCCLQYLNRYCIRS